MIIRQYGITYRRPEESDLEMLRQWRNAPAIVQHMDNKTHITAEMQQAWFKSVNNKQNYYFIIYADSLPVGLVHCKNIDYNLSTGEVGIFISNSDYLRSKTFLYASMTMLNFSFEHILLKNVIIKVMESNHMFLKIVSRLNFKPIQKPDALNKSYTFILTATDYKALFEKYGVITKMLSAEDGELRVDL